MAAHKVLISTFFSHWVILSTQAFGLQQASENCPVKSVDRAQSLCVVWPARELDLWEVNHIWGKSVGTNVSWVCLTKYYHAAKNWMCFGVFPSTSSNTVAICRICFHPPEITTHQNQLPTPPFTCQSIWIVRELKKLNLHHGSCPQHLIWPCPTTIPSEQCGFPHFLFFSSWTIILSAGRHCRAQDSDNPDGLFFKRS